MKSNVYKAVESGTRDHQSSPRPRRGFGISYAAGAARAPAGGPGARVLRLCSLRHGGIRSANSLRRSGIPLLTLLDLHMGAKVRDGQILNMPLPRIESPLLSPAYLLHRPSARRSPNQRGQRIDGACEYLCHSEHFTHTAIKKYFIIIWQKIKSKKEEEQ